VADSAIPLASYADFTAGAFKDLASAYDETVITPYLVRGTRMCERLTKRRLAPFTISETQRADAVDPDEYVESANLPMDIKGTLGWSYAQALDNTTLVRHCWLNEFPPFQQELWTYSGVAVTIIRSYGGTQELSAGQILDGPDETGHMWWQLGLFLPIGSRVRVTYSGGYTVATPGDLVEANCYMTANLIIRELNPVGATQDPEQLHTDALMILEDWGRNS